MIPGVIFSEGPLHDVFMPITVRDMTAQERRFFVEKTEGR